MRRPQSADRVQPETSSVHDGPSGVDKMERKILQFAPLARTLLPSEMPTVPDLRVFRISDEPGPSPTLMIPTLDGRLTDSAICRLLRVERPKDQAEVCVEDLLGCEEFVGEQPVPGDDEDAGRQEQQGEALDRVA